MRCVSVSSSVPSNRPKGARLALFGLGLGVFSLLPNEIGYQDIAALLARQPGVTERWQSRMFASPASAIQVATYSFGRPIGTASPQTANMRLASLGGALGADITGALTRGPLAQTSRPYQASEFPKVDRTMKGDRLVAAPAVAPSDPTDSFPTHQSVMGAKSATSEPASNAPLDPELAEALNAPPLHPADVPLALDIDPLNDARTPVEGIVAGTAPAPAKDGFAVQTANLFFSSSSLGASFETMERWQPGEEPTLVVPDPDMKAPVAPPPQTLVTPDSAGESIASKGEVNADNQKIKTPAERLGLFDPKARARQEKCLADAVYFEARGEAVRGQIAVAQVVMNRAFSGYYPATPCGVVYQNSHRHLACQFTFACDGIRDVVTEPDMWERARKIAKATLDGRLWLPEVAKSTHYHAYWVHPYWVREMKKQYRTGVHTFYRPRKWGDGSDAPSWGTAAQTAEISAKLAEIKP